MVDLWSWNLVDEKVLDWAFAALDTYTYSLVDGNGNANMFQKDVPTAFMVVMLAILVLFEWLESIESSSDSGYEDQHTAISWEVQNIYRYKRNHTHLLLKCSRGVE